MIISICLLNLLVSPLRTLTRRPKAVARIHSVVNELDILHEQNTIIIKVGRLIMYVYMQHTNFEGRGAGGEDSHEGGKTPILGPM